MSFLDLLFLAILLFFLWWGYRSGFTGAVIWFVAVYVSILISAQITGRVLPNIGLPENVSSFVTPIGFAMVSATIFFLANILATGVKQGVSVTPLKWVNVVGGIVVGAALGLAVTLAVIVMAATFTYVVPDDVTSSDALGYALGVSQGYLFDQPRAWLDEQLTSSAIVEMVMIFKPLVVPFAPSDTGIAVDVLEYRIS